MVKSNDYWVGALGEVYVTLELMKRRVASQKLDATMDFDLITEFSDRIEVKTAKLIRKKSGNSGKYKTNKSYYTYCYSFPNQSKYWETIKTGLQKSKMKSRDRRCDFFVFVCMSKENIPVKYYIVPKKIIGTRQVISIPDERKMFRKNSFNLEEYKNKWELITDVSLKSTATGEQDG